LILEPLLGRIVGTGNARTGAFGGGGESSALRRTGAHQAARRLHGILQCVLGIKQDSCFHDAQQQGEKHRRQEGEFDSDRATGCTRAQMTAKNTQFFAKARRHG
jgi:hypothetical protein